MKQVCPSIFSFLGHRPLSLRGGAGVWELKHPVLPLPKGQPPSRTLTLSNLQSVAHDGLSTAGPLCWMVVAYRVPTPAGAVRRGTDGPWAALPRTHGGAKTSGIHVWSPIRKTYSTSRVLQKPAVASSGNDSQISSSEGQPPASGNALLSATAGLRQSTDGMQQADGGSFSREWSDRGPHGYPPSAGPPVHGGQGPPQTAHAYPPGSTPQYHMPPTAPSPSYTAYGYSEGVAPPGSHIQYPGVSPEGYAPGYNTQWAGVAHPEGYVGSAGQQLPPPSQYISPGAFGGPHPAQPYPNTMLPQQQGYYPHAYTGQPDMYRNGPPPANNMPPPQMFPPPPGVPFGNAVGAAPAQHMPAAEDTGYRPDALDPTGGSPNASDSLMGSRPAGQPSSNTSGEDRLEQLLQEIRQRLGIRANTYDAALEESPRALLELACRPESLRRMQHSSLDWWYILFRWQDRYHAMQLSGEIRRQSAAAAASSSDAAAAAAGTGGGSGVEGEKANSFRHFLPEDEKAFFNFLQKLLQAFAARPLSEEAQTHGRLHDRMRCIRQLARTVSDDHRALGMAAAARREADNLLWSLTVQEARCAANDIDLLRTKGGMPMLLSILRLAETADRRRRKGATRVLVPHKDTTNDASKAPASAADPDKRQHEVVVQNFPGGRELKWVLVSGEDTQAVFEKLAEAFLKCAQEANIEPCVHAVVGLAVLAERGFVQEATWLKVCQAMHDRLKLSELVSAGTEAGLLLDALAWMLVRNPSASRRCRSLPFQVNLVLGQILRDTRSDVVARCVLGLALARCLREENLLFYTNVLLKRQLRSEERRKTLTPRAFCNLLTANAIAGVPTSQHLVVPVKYLLNTMATHDRARNLTLEESARLAWTICAMQLYDPATAGSQWPAKEAAELLSRVLSRVNNLVDGPQAAFLFEAMRDSHDCVAPLYPGMGFEDKYADQTIRQRTCAAYDHLHLGYGGATVTLVRNGLRSLGGTITMSPERHAVLNKWRNTPSPSEESDTPFDTGETATASGPDSVDDEVPEKSSAGGKELPSTNSADDVDADGTSASAPTITAAEAAAEKGNTGEGGTDKERGDSEAGGGITEGGGATPSGASTRDTTEGGIPVEPRREAQWLEGAVINGYPVAFYSPNAKIALDIDLCSKLPSKYMKRRHLDSYLRANGIRYAVFSADLKRPQEQLFSCLERVLKDESGTLSEVASNPVSLRAYVRTTRGSRRPTGEDMQESV